MSAQLLRSSQSARQPFRTWQIKKRFTARIENVKMYNAHLIKSVEIRLYVNKSRCDHVIRHALF